MAFSFARVAVAAFAIAVGFFLFHLFLVPPHGTAESSFAYQNTSSAFESGRRNYASIRAPATGMLIGDSQKYEKIATLTQASESFDADRRLIESRIAEHGGITQLERASGLSGLRTLHLGIGVPPDRF